MKFLIKVALYLVALTASPVYAVHCTAPGTINVLKANNGDSFIFYPSRSYGDTVFELPGTDFRKDADAPPGTTQFFVDGIHYQYLTTQKSQFVVKDAVADDASVLAKHAEYEHRYVLSAGGPLSDFQDLGNRQKPANQGNPSFTFKLWLLKNPKKPNGARQLYLTSVVGDEVASLSAIALSPTKERQVISAFTEFAASFQFVPSEQACPPQPSSDVQQSVPANRKKAALFTSRRPSR